MEIIFIKISEFIWTIEGFTYPIIYLVLLFYCFIKLRNKENKFLVLGFGILFVSSIISIPPEGKYNLQKLLMDNLNIYTFIIFERANFFATLIFAALFIAWISRIVSSTDITKEEIMQGNLTNQNGSDQSFGSIGFYIAMLFIGLFIFVTGIFLAQERSNQDTAMAMIIIGLIIFLIAEIYFLVLLYRVWQFTINQSHRHDLIPSIETPGKAVGFLFIPIYSLYWIFQAFGKLPKDLNAVARAKENTDTMSEGLGTAIAVLTLIGVIPFIGYVTAFISSFILAPIFINQSINLCKSLSHVTSTQVTSS